ncbi:MAG: hypothetical protein ACI9LH_001330, partial [Porticoccaceae bacterium]
MSIRGVNAPSRIQISLRTGYWLLATGYRLSAAKAGYVFVR